jgi:hypothetical protein
MKKVLALCCVLLALCVLSAGVVQADSSVVWLTTEGRAYLADLSSRYNVEVNGVRIFLTDQELKDYLRLKQIATLNYMSVPGDSQYLRLELRGYVLDCYTGWTKWDAARAAQLRAADQWVIFNTGTKITKLAGGIQVWFKSGDAVIYYPGGIKTTCGAYIVPKVICPMANVYPPKASLVNGRVVITQAYASGGSSTVLIRIPCK